MVAVEGTVAPEVTSMPPPRPKLLRSSPVAELYSPSAGYFPIEAKREIEIIARMWLPQSKPAIPQNARRDCKHAERALALEGPIVVGIPVDCRDNHRLMETVQPNDLN